MARQTTTTMISTFLVRSLIHDFPKRSMIALARADTSVAGPSNPQQGHLAEHQRLVLLLRANDLGFRAENLQKIMVPLTGDDRRDAERSAQ